MKKLMAIILTICLLSGYVPSYAQNVQIDEAFAQKRADLEENIKEIPAEERDILSTVAVLSLAGVSIYAIYAVNKANSGTPLTIEGLEKLLNKVQKMKGGGRAVGSAMTLEEVEILLKELYEQKARVHSPMHRVADMNLDAFMYQVRQLEQKHPLRLDREISVRFEFETETYVLAKGHEDEILKDASKFMKKMYDVTPEEYAKWSRELTPNSYLTEQKRLTKIMLSTKPYAKKKVLSASVKENIGFAKAGTYLKAGATKWVALAMLPLMLALGSASPAEAKIAQRIEKYPAVVFALTDEQAAVVANSDTLREIYFGVADAVEDYLQIPAEQRTQMWQDRQDAEAQQRRIKTELSDRLRPLSY